MAPRQQQGGALAGLPTPQSWLWGQPACHAPGWGREDQHEPPAGRRLKAQEGRWQRGGQRHRQLVSSVTSLRHTGGTHRARITNTIGPMIQLLSALVHRTCNKHEGLLLPFWFETNVLCR